MYIVLSSNTRPSSFLLPLGVCLIFLVFHNLRPDHSWIVAVGWPGETPNPWIDHEYRVMISVVVGVNAWTELHRKWSSSECAIEIPWFDFHFEGRAPWFVALRYYRGTYEQIQKYASARFASPYWCLLRPCNFFVASRPLIFSLCLSVGYFFCIVLIWDIREGTLCSTVTV